MVNRMLTALILLAVVGCSGDDEPAGSPEPAPLLTVTNSWGVEGEADHAFNFNSDDDEQDAGTFEGNERTPDGDFFDLTGSWAAGEVTFTVDRDGGATYTASFSEDNPTRLVFRRGSEELVLLLGG